MALTIRLLDPLSEIPFLFLETINHVCNFDCLKISKSSSLV